ncbi:MAG: M28 family metallopeptidase [Anaerolineae bacterium]
MSERMPPARRRVWLLLLVLLVLVLLASAVLALERGWIAPPPGWVAAPTATDTAPATPTPTRLPTATLESSPTPADLGTAQRFDAERALQTVRALTDRAFAGRQGGSPGGAAVAMYLAQRFDALGLQPAGDDGYYQPVPLPYAALTAVPTFSARRTDGTRLDLAFRESFAPLWGGRAAGGVAEGRLVWMGTGSAPLFERADVAGQVVLVSGRPSDEELALAAERGAVGLVAVVEEERLVTTRLAYRDGPADGARLVAAFITQEALANLLAGSAVAPDNLTNADASLQLDVSVRMSVALEEQGAAEGRNVLGVLPGADPARRDEVVIIGAHYDHLGVDPNGDVYVGANDNASGVAAMLEIARMWQEADYRPARTVLFAAWDGEEQALLGSQHYVQDPSYPLTQTVAMIQLDMVGLASEGVLTVAGLESAISDAQGQVLLESVTNPAARAVLAGAERLGVPTRRVSFPGGSDHASFLQAGVPATLLIWDDAEVPYYHTPDDVWQTLQPERLAQAGVIAADAAMALADAPVDSAALALPHWAAGARFLAPAAAF